MLRKYKHKREKYEKNYTQPKGRTCVGNFSYNTVEEKNIADKKIIGNYI
jgi:hypothetical protein